MSTATSTISINTAFSGLFDKAVSLLSLAETGELGAVKVRDYIDTAFDVACLYCPSVTSMPFATGAGYERRRVVSFVSQIWLKEQEVEA